MGFWSLFKDVAHVADKALEITGKVINGAEHQLKDTSRVLNDMSSQSWSGGIWKGKS
jgi:ABC-type xylose transport system substrate-binding protein